MAIAYKEVDVKEFWSTVHTTATWGTATATPLVETKPKPDLTSFPTKIKPSDAMREGMKKAHFTSHHYLIGQTMWDPSGRIKPEIMACSMGMIYLGLGGDDYSPEFGRPIRTDERAKAYDIPDSHMDFIKEKTGIDFMAPATNYGFHNPNPLVSMVISKTSQTGSPHAVLEMLESHGL